MAHIPFGHRIERGAALIHPHEKRQLETLYTAFIHGGTYADSLELSGIQRSVSSARRLLANETYRGTDFYPRLLDDSLIDAAKAEIARREVPHRSGWKRRERVSVDTDFIPPHPPPPIQGEGILEYISRLYSSITVIP